MKLTTKILSCLALLSAMALPTVAQTPAAATETLPAQAQPSAPAAPLAAQYVPVTAPASSAVKELLAFTDSDVKFDLSGLMNILSDRRHEGWVLAAYPDPKTAQPLIGAGVSLDLPVREHAQRDPLNPHPFIEPSSSDLWQAAGLDPELLKAILASFHSRLASWGKKGFRKKIKTLTPEITDEDATLLLRVSAVQAIYNAKGYCRNFDRLTASQQMALSQLVYQMGVNLQEFNQFLELINNSTGGGDPVDAPALRNAVATGPASGYWKTVQQSLVKSQWARLYRNRAVAVIAMLDPQYGDGPGTAEQRVGAMLRPAVLHRSHSAGSRRAGSTARRARSRQTRKRRV